MSFRQDEIRKNFPPWPQFDEEEIKAVTDVIKSGKWWCGSPAVHQGEQVWKFQEEFAEYEGAKYCFACTNGTHALEISLMALDIGLGDEVIVPVTTFVATASAVVGVNAVPIFCDVHPETFNIDVDKIESLITDRTKAIIPVHLGGNPVEMDRVMEIAEKYDLKVIEDCAHAHGSKYKGKRLGNWGDCGTFSFQASKVLTAGEGGAIICNDEELADKIYSVLDCGRKVGEYFYNHYTYGSNYRMPELLAAVLRTQLRKFPAQHKKRNENAVYLAEKLNAIDGLMCQKRPEGTEEVGQYIFPVKFDPAKFNGITKAEFYKYLNDNGIPTDDCYPPLHRLHMFKEIKLKKGIDYSNANWGGAKSDDKNWPVAVDIFEHSFEFPQEMLLGTREQMDYVAETIEKLKNK